MYYKMKKLTIIILIVAIAVTMTACGHKSEFEQRVIEAACSELGVNSEGASVDLAFAEYVDWLDCICFTYVLTLENGDQYVVGARENADGFYCDVEREIV